MNALTNLVANSNVLDTLIVTMLITSLLAALPKPGTITIKNIWDALGLAYRVMYDWATGFWTLKTGHPIELHTETSEPTPSGPKTSESTLTTESPSPLDQPPSAAQPQPK